MSHDKIKGNPKSTWFEIRNVIFRKRHEKTYNSIENPWQLEWNDDKKLLFKRDAGQIIKQTIWAEESQAREHNFFLECGRQMQIIKCASSQNTHRAHTHTYTHTHTRARVPKTHAHLEMPTVPFQIFAMMCDLSDAPAHFVMQLMPSNVTSSSDLGPRYFMVHLPWLHSRHSAAEKNCTVKGGNHSQRGSTKSQAPEATDYHEINGATLHTSTHHSIFSPAHMISWFYADLAEPNRTKVCLQHQKTRNYSSTHTHTHINLIASIAKNMGCDCDMEWSWMIYQIVWDRIRPFLCVSVWSEHCICIILSSHGIPGVDLQGLKQGMHWAALRSGNLCLSHLVRVAGSACQISQGNRITMEIPWKYHDIRNLLKRKPSHSFPRGLIKGSQMDYQGRTQKNGREICRDTNLTCGCFIHLCLRQAMQARSSMAILMKGWRVTIWPRA